MEEKNTNSEKIVSGQSASKNSFIKESLLAGWNILRWRPWYVTGVPILVGIIVALIAFVPGVVIMVIATFILVATKGSSMAIIFSGLFTLLLIGILIYVMFKLIIPVSMFQYIFIRNILINKEEDIKKTLKSLMSVNLAGRFFGGVLLLMLVMLGGMILLIVPGIIWGIKFMFAPMLILDKNMRIMDAFRVSSRMTNGYKWPLFAYGLLVGLVGFGLIGSIVGSLVIMPIYLTSYIFMYLVFDGQTNNIKLKTEKAPLWQLITLIIVSVLLNILGYYIDAQKQEQLQRQEQLKQQQGQFQQEIGNEKYFIKAS